MKITGNWTLKTNNSITISTNLGYKLACIVDKYAEDQHNNNLSDALRYLWEIALDSDMPVIPYHISNEGLINSRYTLKVKITMLDIISDIPGYNENKSAIYRSLTNIGLNIIKED